MRLAMPRTTSRLVVAAALLALAWILPTVRRQLIEDVTTWDARPSEPAQLPGGDGPGLSPVAHTRVVLIDGLAADTARTLPVWSAVCKRGATLTIDVGFPTISLPVESALWSGLTQQQSGIVFRSDRPLDPALRGIPSQVPGSVAIAESHGYIVRSLGFASVQPKPDPADAARDATTTDEVSFTPASGGAPWSREFVAAATRAISSEARLVFVHILRVDTAGHKFGHDAAEYAATAREADAMLDVLFAADPSARWFLLSDHGHLPAGGHGGEELAVRQVQGCVIGPGVTPGLGSLVHVVDIARAIADSVDVKLDPASPGRPLSVAMRLPLSSQQALPNTPLGTGGGAILILIIGLVVTASAVRRWSGAPWWFAIACASLVLVRGEPTLSMRMIYKPHGQTMFITWLPALAIAFAATWIALRSQPLWRVLVAQLAAPFAALAAALTVCGAWPALLGAEVAPVVPRYTAWSSPLLLIVAHGAAAVALAVLGRTVQSAFGRREPRETRRSDREAA
ncbi:MAG: hypothetical protein JWO36_7267 [Myxococcales bacterium]|nr:hypothetical protein [Myxococcales bacterium]